MIVDSYRKVVWKQFKKSKIGIIALLFLALFFLIGLYAPFLSSSKPILVVWNGKPFFPLFRYLFYRGFYTKPIDLFYNLLMFTLPLLLLGLRYRWLFWTTCFLQFALFSFLLSGFVKDPKSNMGKRMERENALESLSIYREDPLLAPIRLYPTWNFELKYMTSHAKLALLLDYLNQKKQHERLAPYASQFEAKWNSVMPTLWSVAKRNNEEKRQQLEKQIETSKEEYFHALDQLPELTSIYLPLSHEHLIAKLDLKEMEEEKAFSKAKHKLSQTRSTIQQYRDATAELHFMNEKEQWLAKETSQLKVVIPSLLRSFHWEDDAGGSQRINQVVPWWELTRINRKDLVASLIFGIRVSLIVGFTAVLIAVLIGLPLGTFSGYFAGKIDLIVCRLIEVWEAMPTFFMLLLVVALTQSKSIFLVIAVLGMFGWTSFARFMRAEVLKQRSLAYVLACKSLGYRHPKIMFSHILPNAVPPILTLLPFSMMAAITSEAGLSFLGLGEEGSTSWGVLMDEGRSVFPAESYLLWPPAILLTTLLICIALVGDVTRDAIDPKMRS
ncbi:MAG: hypothetical protein S4CHLAM45_12140 [Chlamydiales bacterium]|nr:hypothetical protein [Chlamydiales bacterium]MCH9619703.1 hypothetical protein [Chlamydiales bacterium]MCH9623309.1 hypothetical protein [Chlamydiales bacterium]